MNTATIMMRRIRLAELLEGEVDISEALDTELTGIEIDSRKVEAGDLFLACKGSVHDGRDFIDAAISAGAAAVLVDTETAGEAPAMHAGVPVIPVEKLAFRISKIAARFFDYPARALWLVGITGTNGKTSTCQFIAQWYSLLNHKCGVCGTLGYGLFGGELSMPGQGPGTTPDAITVQRIIEEVRFARADVMAMEVSSHGLRQGRVNVPEFDVAVFTNLSRDHLDYHGNMDAYGEAKRILFSHAGLKVAVVNLDDVFSNAILNSLNKGVSSYTYSLHNDRASVHASHLEFHPRGFVMDVVTPWGKGRIESGLLGAFNVSNLLAAMTTVMAGESCRADFDFQSVLNSAKAISPVRGRMEVIGGAPVSVVVDYAHTPDALKTALTALRQHYDGKLWCVFGCGGNRDQGKRPLMAAAAEKLADRLVITSDNPRQESPEQIIRQMLAGLKQPQSATVESDRAQAIDLAVSQAGEGDVILIAGKGHEEYQDIGGNRMAFSDVKQARLCLNKRFESGQLI